MDYKLESTRVFDKQFKKLDAQSRNKVFRVIDKIVKNPDIGKPLQYSLRSLRRIRFDCFRLIYEVKSGTIVLIKIGHRKNIY